jgi:hypothetical protein
MRRRMGRPGLLGTMARTAVIATTATAVAGGTSRRATHRAAEQEQAAAYRQQELVDQTAAQVQSRQPAAGPDDRLSRLKELGELRSSGVLTDDEFAAEKARILAS